MSIEKLAKEHGITITHNGYAGETNLLNVETAEAFAKAYAQQQSEPYGYVRFENYHNKDAIKGEWLNRTPVSDDDITVYAHPPAPVQSSEPVAYNHHFIQDDDFMPEEVLSHRPEVPVIFGCKYAGRTDKLFTHPPAAVSLEKYNKLLEDYRCLRDDTLFTAIKMGISAGIRQAQDECLGNSNIHYADETLILEHCWAIEAKRKQAIAEAEGNEG